MLTRRIALGALLMAGLVMGQDLVGLKTAYESRRAALVAGRDAVVGKALAAYKAELGTLLANVRQQGNLDYVLAIEAEQKRLEAGGGAPAEPAAKAFVHLRRVQWATRQAEDKADAELAEETGKLRKQYVAALEKLEKDLVAANRIEEAKAARDEREGTMEEEEERFAEVEVKGTQEHELLLLKNGAKMHLTYNRTWTDVPDACDGWWYVRAVPTQSPEVKVLCKTAGTVFLAIAVEHFPTCEKAGWADTGIRLTATTGRKWRHEYWIVSRRAEKGDSVTFPNGLEGELPVYLVPKTMH